MLVVEILGNTGPITCLSIWPCLPNGRSFREWVLGYERDFVLSAVPILIVVVVSLAAARSSPLRCRAVLGASARSGATASAHVRSIAGGLCMVPQLGASRARSERALRKLSLRCSGVTEP